MMDTKDSWSRQAKAARELLRWSQLDLVEKSGLSIGTIKNFERGLQQTIGTTAALRQTFERAGIQFILDNQGGVDHVGVVLVAKE